MMRYLALVALCTLLHLSYSVDNGMFICKRVESECNERTVIRKPNKNNNIRLRPTQKSRPKPQPKPAASSLKTSLEQRLRDLEERIERLERTSRENDVDTSTEKLPTDEMSEETCMAQKDVWYRNSCFMFVEKTFGAISLKEAEGKCKEIKGELANIYDVVHFRKIESFLRETIEAEEEMEYFIVGMTFQSETNTVLQRDGSPASYVTWYSDTIYPSMNKDDTRIHIQVNKMGSSPSGMFNVSPLAQAKSALCEVPAGRLYKESYVVGEDRA